MWLKLTTSHHSKRSQSIIDRGSSPLHSWTSLNYLVTHLCKSIFRNSKTRSQIVPCKSISIPLGIPPRSLGNETITKGPSALSHSSRYYVPCAYTLHKEDHGLQDPYMKTRTMAHQKESRWRRTQDIVYKYAPTSRSLSKPSRRDVLTRVFQVSRLTIGMEPELYPRLASRCCPLPTCWRLS